MHIHVPKPIHGWRQFFNEVFVIAVGIAIALGGEDALASWREHHQADKSLGAIKDELALNLGRMKSRINTADCIDRRLDAIALYIEGPQSSQRPSWVGRPQVWTMQASALDAGTAYGSLTVLPREQQMAISTVYGSMRGFAEIEMDEQWAWAELRSITEDRDLTDSDKASLRQALQRARYAAWKLRIDATQAIQNARALGVQPNQAEQGSQSVCVAMTTPFPQAVRISNRATNYPEPH